MALLHGADTAIPASGKEQESRHSHYKVRAVMSSEDPFSQLEQMFKKQFETENRPAPMGLCTKKDWPILGAYFLYESLSHSLQFDIRRSFDFGKIDNYLYLIDLHGSLRARRRKSSFEPSEITTLVEAHHAKTNAL